MYFTLQRQTTIEIRRGGILKWQHLMSKLNKLHFFDKLLILSHISTRGPIMLLPKRKHYLFYFFWCQQHFRGATSATTPIQFFKKWNHLIKRKTTPRDRTMVIQSTGKKPNHLTGGTALDMAWSLWTLDGEPSIGFMWSCPSTSLAWSTLQDCTSRWSPHTTLGKRSVA